MGGILPAIQEKDGAEFAVGEEGSGFDTQGGSAIADYFGNYGGHRNLSENRETDTDEKLL